MLRKRRRLWRGRGRGRNFSRGMRLRELSRRPVKQQLPTSFCPSLERLRGLGGGGGEEEEEEEEEGGVEKVEKEEGEVEEGGWGKVGKKMVDTERGGWRWRCVSG